MTVRGELVERQGQGNWGNDIDSCTGESFIQLND